MYNPDFPTSRRFAHPAVIASSSSSSSSSSPSEDVDSDSPLNAVSHSSLFTVFKNGSYFVHRELRVDASHESASFTFNRVPQASFGTIFFGTPQKASESESASVSKKIKTESKKEEEEDNPIVQVSSQLCEIPHIRNCEDIPTLLAANINQEAIVAIQQINQEEKEVKCVIDSLRGGVVVLRLGSREETEWLAIETSRVLYVKLLGRPKFHLDSTRKQRAIKIQFSKPRKDQPLSMVYLAKGLSFMATYSLDMISDDMGVLQLKADLLNDAESFEGVDLNLVVGVPNFKFLEVQSPLGSTETLKEFLNSIANSGVPKPATALMHNMMSNTGMMSQQVMRPPPMQPGRSAPLSEDSGELKEDIGTQSQDLYMYHIKNVSLAKHGRALLNVLEAKVHLDHIYTVQLGENDTEQLLSLPVAHSIRFRNPTSSPFTTGSILLTSAQYKTPIAQSQLRFVPAGGYGVVKLTNTPSLSVNHRLETVDQTMIAHIDTRTLEEKSNDQRKKKEDPFYRSEAPMYWQRQVMGKITIQSHVGKELVLTCKRSVTGRQVQVKEQPWFEFTQSKKAVGSSPYNDTNDLVLEVKVPAASTALCITYTYIYTYQSGTHNLLTMP